MTCVLRKRSQIMPQFQSDLKLSRNPFFSSQPFFVSGMFGSHFLSQNLPPAKCLCLGIVHLGLFCLHWSGSGFQGLCGDGGRGCEVVKKTLPTRCLEHLGTNLSKKPVLTVGLLDMRCLESWKIRLTHKIRVLFFPHWHVKNVGYTVSWKYD